MLLWGLTQCRKSELFYFSGLLLPYPHLLLILLTLLFISSTDKVQKNPRRKNSHFAQVESSLCSEDSSPFSKCTHFCKHSRYSLD